MEHHNHTATTPPALSAHPPLRDYLPLATVFAVILTGTLALMTGSSWSLQHFLAYSMGLFFLIFAMFKLMDLFNFAHGYHEYDLVAKKMFAWGFAYPFIEAALGIFYLANIDAPWLHGLTILLSTITVVSVGIKLAKHEVVQCACLGTVLKIPITYVSLIEYLLMAIMALGMLFL